MRAACRRGTLRGVRLWRRLLGSGHFNVERLLVGLLKDRQGLGAAVHDRPLAFGKLTAKYLDNPGG